MNKEPKKVVHGKTSRPGFTLIELLIVVAIIGILAAIAVPSFITAQIRANVAHSLSEMRTYKMVQGLYSMDQGDVPGHYDGNQEHCPYINLEYLNTKLTDPFCTENHPSYKYHEGMYHSTHVRDPTGLKLINPEFWAEWQRGGAGYIIRGEGPGPGNWIHYNPSNGLKSAGWIMSIGSKAKGTPSSNLPNRKCD